MPGPGRTIRRQALNLKMTPDGGRAFAAHQANVGKTIDLSVAGTVVMSPRLVEPILGGEVMISGKFAQGELRRPRNAFRPEGESHGRRECAVAFDEG